MTSTALPSPSDRTLWISGAGSGMGRSIALSAARAGYSVVLSGRRAAALEEVVTEVLHAGGTARALPLDVTDTAAIAAAAAHIRSTAGPVTDLVLSAGLNTPHRYWRDQTMTDFEAIVRTNLTGAAAMVDAVLPDLREAGGGAVVFVSSYSGWRFSPHSGVAYSASKTALSGLAEMLNDQENRNGIRACNLCPGDVDSDFLSMRPEVPDAEARQSMLTPDDVATAVQFVLDSPPHVCINELVISPTKKD